MRNSKGVPPPNGGSYARLAGVVAGDTGVPPPTAGATLDFDIRCKTRGPAAVRLERVNIYGGFLGSVRACVRACVRALHKQSAHTEILHCSGWS